MSIYTKTGDKGQTALASGQRVSKTDARLEAYGTADELNSFVGLLGCYLKEEEQMSEQIAWVQNKLFNLGAALAEAKGEWIDGNDVQQVEQWIDAMQEEIPPMRDFVLPGGNEAVSLCHVCRTITRRLERQVLRLADDDAIEKPSDEIYKFINRLSDFWFMFAQKCAKNARISCLIWKK